MNVAPGSRRLAGWRASLARLATAAGLALLWTPAAPAAPRVLTLAIADLPYAAPVLIAKAEGYFEAEGLALNFLHCAVGRICLQQLLDGQAQFATVADTPIAIAAHTRKGFAILATTTKSGAELRMVVRQDRGIHVPADLRGKRIGVVKGTTSHYFADTFLLFHGVRPSDVTLVPMEPGNVAAPLIDGRVDAAGLFEPSGRDALRQLGSQGRAFSTPAFFTLTFNLVSAGPAAGVSASDSVKLLRAVARATALLRDEPRRAHAIVAAALKLDPATLADAWSAFDFRLQLGQPLIATLESQARWAERDGLVPAGAPLPDFLDFIDVAPLGVVDPAAMRLVK